MSKKFGTYGMLGAVFVLTCALGFAVVWVNIERVDARYEVKALEQTYQDVLEQNSKLQVERHYLLAPASLRKKATAAGLKPPRRDQIRIAD